MSTNLISGAHQFADQSTMASSSPWGIFSRASYRWIHYVLFCMTIGALCSQGQQTATAEKTDQVERFALLVGINNYIQPSNKNYGVRPLGGPENDVKLITDLLVNQYGFKNDQAHILSLIGPRATHEGIAKAFKNQLTGNASKHPNAVVVFYFSGHGAYLRDAEGMDHNTLVAYDSRADSGTDIVDNEIINWFEELRKYTTNITFVLDSCHSGSAIKGGGAMLARGLDPNPRQNGKSSLGAPALPSSRSADYILPRRQQYVLLSASLADELSFEGPVPTTATGTTQDGFFTYSMVRALRHQPDTSNERAMQATALDVAKFAPYQHPQAVGNIEGRVFGGTGERDDPYITFASEPNGDHFEISAGAVQGITEGAFLAIYDPKAKHLAGETDKLANARVTRVGATTSTAELSDKPKRPLDKTDKVAIVTPFFGFEPVRVWVRSLANPSQAEQQMLEEVAAKLSENKLVELVKSGEPWDLAIQRGCVADKRLYGAAKKASFPPQCSAAYYLIAQQGDDPLLSFHTLATDTGSSKQLAEVIGRWVKQKNLRALDNAVSPMRDQLKISLITVTVQMDKTGRAIAVPTSEAINDGTQPLNIGQNFQLQIENKTNQDLYAAIYMLGTSGAIELITTNPNGDRILAGQRVVVTRVPRTIGPPLGLETYKVFASTSPNVDYRILEQPGAKSAATSPFEWILKQSTNLAAKDSNINQDLNVDDWTTATLNVDVKQ